MAFIGNPPALCVAVRNREDQSPGEYAIGERDATAFITARILALSVEHSIARSIASYCKMIDERNTL